MNVIEMAQKYYPKLWDLSRIKALTAAEKLTADQYKAITGEDYSTTTGSTSSATTTAGTATSST